MNMNVRNGTKTSLLAVAAEVLALDPMAPLAVIAEVAGISRTTLHKRYPKRHELLLAVAHDSITEFEQAMVESGAADPESRPDEALRRLVEIGVAIGARVSFLIRQPTLDSEKEVQIGIDRLEAGLNGFIARAQQAGLFRANLPQWWVVSTLYYTVFGAWESVAMGRLAPLDAPRLALETVMSGLGAPQ